uniref:Uncharacterized protein n=1 Tax=Panthera leo TaxID=9689 RepID=A0A8C8XDI4_PANLE
MKILVFAFIMALMVAMIGADSSEEGVYFPSWQYWQHPQSEISQRITLQ